MVEMLDTAYTTSGSVDRDQWCLDNWAAVCAHIGAAQRLTSGAASGLLMVATALRDRLPKVAAVFAAGLITYQLARAIVHRSMLVTNRDALHTLDAALAEALQSWEPMSLDKTEKTIDAFIAQFDPQAVRRTQTQSRNRSLDVVIEDGSGLATLFGTLFAHDAKALDARVAALADTVCAADPRTVDQRRADATGALAHGADRLACLCNTEDCPAVTTAVSSGVIIHVVAHHDTITGSPTPESRGAPDDPHGLPATDEDCAPDDECAGLDGPPAALFSKPLRELTLTEALTDSASGKPSIIRPATIMGGQFLPGPIARRAALNATLTTVIHPGLAPPEPRYAPSKKLTDFVRCRDLTCRFPGCSVPATRCDIDHTIPWPYGHTCASNLKALCRKHHLLKTFWSGPCGWHDQQQPDGTIVWTAPDGQMHTTTPGSRLLFPTLCEPTAPVVCDAVPTANIEGLTMPRRQCTRSQDRSRRINAERELNCAADKESEQSAPDSSP